MSFETFRDSQNRVCAQIAEGVTAAIKIFSETDERRTQKNQHGYCVMDLGTAFGQIRIRDIKIMWSQKNSRFYLRWRQWPTGGQRGDKPEFLDVAGPRDKETRDRFQDALLQLFLQLKEQAVTAVGGTLAQNPELLALRDSLAHDSGEVEADGNVAETSALVPVEGSVGNQA